MLKECLMLCVRSASVPAEEETPGLPREEGEKGGRQGPAREGGQQQLPAARETALPGGAEPR